MSKCFCHLVDRATGEEYEVKDATARKVATEADNRSMGNETAISDVWHILGVQAQTNTNAIEDLNMRLILLENSGGSGGSGGSVTLYRHDIYASLSSSSNLSSLNINYTVYTKSATAYNANTFQDLLYQIPEGRSVGVTGTGYNTSSEMIIPYRLSYMHEYDEYYTLALYYAYVSNGAMQEGVEYGIWFTDVTDTVTEIK